MLCAALIALHGCAGPTTRLYSPPPTSTPPPVVDGNGAVAPQRAGALLRSAVASSDDPVPTTTLVQAIRESCAQAPFIAGNRVEMLIDGPDTFAAAIADARHHVHVETYMFSDDEIGRAFGELLAQKSAEGVEVRVIYDAVGSLSADTSGLFERMQAEGVAIVAFRPLDSLTTLLSGTINNRDHRKLLVVDGKVGFVGGINISATYDSSSGSKPGPAAGLGDGWRDSQARIEGPAVHQLQALFFATWAQSGGAPVAPEPAYFPRLAAAGDEVVAMVASEFNAANQAAILAAYLGAIRHAQQRVWITQAYFAPDQAVRAALLAAARRGVDVRIILPGFSDSDIALSAARSIYDELLAAGVRMYEFHDAFLHAKTALFDDAASFVGSANLDLRSLLHNNEVIAVIIGARTAESLRLTFSRDLDTAREVTAALWQRRPPLVRAREALSRVFWFWL